MPRPVSNAEKDYSENHNKGDEIVNITIFGQPVTPDWGQLGLEILVFVLVYAALLAAVRFLFTPINRKISNKITNIIDPPIEPDLNKTVQDQTLGIRCTHCDTKNPAGVTTCIGSGKRLL